MENVESFSSLTGFGVIGKVNLRSIIVGNESLMKEHSISINGTNEISERLSKEGKTPVFVASDGKLIGITAIADTILPSSKSAIEQLKKMSLDIIMITGDNERTAKAIASQAGIEKVIAEVLPQDKVMHVKGIQSAGKFAAMVGDGINDSPALAAADVGIAIGTGTDVAIETSDIAVISGDLIGIVRTIRLSRKTMKTIKQNLFWAFIYNIIGIPVAALGFLNPIYAAAAMAFSSVSVVSNSLLLRRAKLEKS